MVLLVLLGLAVFCSEAAETPSGKAAETGNGSRIFEALRGCTPFLERRGKKREHAAAAMRARVG